MNSAATLISALGGITVFVVALVATTRAIFRQVSTIERNTTAVVELTRKLEAASNLAVDHEHRITMLEGKS